MEASIAFSMSSCNIFVVVSYVVTRPLKAILVAAAPCCNILVVVSYVVTASGVSPMYTTCLSCNILVVVSYVVTLNLKRKDIVKTDKLQYLGSRQLCCNRLVKSVLCTF